MGDLQEVKAKSILTIRNAEISDIEPIRTLLRRVYPTFPPYSADRLEKHITQFPEGQFVAVWGDTDPANVIGYCATFRISGEIALKPHSWMEITGKGYASQHDPEGDYLYGMEVSVDPEYRHMRIGHKLYSQRKRLCKRLRLRGIIIGGRMPKLGRRIKKVGTPENYLDLIQQRKLRDPVVSFQLRNGFKLLGVLKDYLPNDFESLGYAAHMIWKNPYYKS